MPVFSKSSREKLITCHVDLQDICKEVIIIYNYTILDGHRNKDRQNLLFQQGKSKLQWPDSKHNTSPSLAIDVAPYPIDWMDIKRFYTLGGLMMATAHAKGKRLSWGADWDGDWNFKNNKFDDLCHFELLI